MKKGIVYYSLEGNTEYIADKLSDALGAGKLRLMLEKPLFTGMTRIVSRM